ncbi:transmembrane 4 L6 family member 1 isoform X2 [Chanodichthys erythropterus]|uniref:transmembrane 4 L6 family member 1 isoform X2 n=1 Tax=Chanodichthys erythropterus TaxID=933992 RepID=UPI00351F0C6A
MILNSFLVSAKFSQTTWQLLALTGTIRTIYLLSASQRVEKGRTGELKETVWRTEEITEKIWFFPGVIGGGLLVFLPASVIRAAGLEGNCCANRCGMMLSMLMSVLGAAGALYCMIVSVVGLQDGPLCDTGDGIFIYPFLNRTTEGSYLSNQTLWIECERPQNVVLWNVVLFSILLSIGTLEAVLLLAQVVNGLIGCLCGTCMNENQTQLA